MPPRTALDVVAIRRPHEYLFSVGQASFSGRAWRRTGSGQPVAPEFMSRGARFVPEPVR